MLKVTDSARQTSQTRENTTHKQSSVTRRDSIKTRARFLDSALFFKVDERPRKLLKCPARSNKNECSFVEGGMKKRKVIRQEAPRKRAVTQCQCLIINHSYVGRETKGTATKEPGRVGRDRRQKNPTASRFFHSKKTRIQSANHTRRLSGPRISSGHSKV